MAKRDNPYEAAFEAYLRERQVSYVAVDEARRSPLADATLKSLDFIVALATGAGSWLVDVKGRRFPGGALSQQYWRNWTTRDDLWSLARWEQLFGRQFGGLFVFAYHVVASRAPVSPQQLFEFRGQCYGFVGIRLQDYARHARPISARWNSVAMPTSRFRALAAPIDYFLTAGTPVDWPAAAFADAEICLDGPFDAQDELGLASDGLEYSPHAPALHATTGSANGTVTA